MRAGLRALGLVVVVAAMSAPSAHAAGGEVAVWDTSGKRPVPCPAIDASKPLQPRGGCAFDMFSEDIEIVVRSVVGDMVFGDCTYEHDMRVDGSGRTLLEGVTSGGPSPCPDAGACDHDEIRPWRGQIEAGPDGRLTHVVDACLDTCMGQFVGELELSLKRVGSRWVQTADRALVGDTGYRIDGSWRMGERDIDIRPVSGSAGGDAASAWLLTGQPVGWPI